MPFSIVASDGSANGKGKDVLGDPDFTANIAASYAFTTPIGEITPTVNGSYNSGFFYYPDNRLRQPSYGLLNMSLSWISPNNTYRATAWVKNLTDTEYYQGRSEIVNFYDVQRYAAPRTFGVNVGIRF